MNKEMQSAVSKLLERWIEESGASIEEIARNTCINPQTLKAIGNGLIKLPIVVIPKLASALKRDPRFLFFAAVGEYQLDTTTLMQSLLTDFAITDGEKAFVRRFLDISEEGEFS